jgi:hypothetical protein
MFFSNRTSKARTVMATVILLLMGGNAMSYEQPEYTVLFTDGDLEYRQYETYLVSETVIEDARNSDAAGDEGFRRLFRYITGANTSQAKVSMTVPVSQSASASADSENSEKISMTVPVQQSTAATGWRVSFMLPSEYTLETAPVPADSRVYVREVPGRLMAVKVFSGRWTEANYRSNGEKLRAALDDQGLTATGELERAAYNAPFSLPFMRRNEVMLAVNALPRSANEYADVDASVAAETTLAAY